MPSRARHSIGRARAAYLRVPPRLALIGLAVALTYIISARLGFRAAYVAEQVTTVWAPTGIAQAARLVAVAFLGDTDLLLGFLAFGMPGRQSAE